jgi:nuclear transport factor 2 (NTF2) superfamily protein
MIPSLETARKIAEAHCAAWTSHDAEKIASRYATTPDFSINRGDPMTTRADIAEMAAGFISDFPDLVLSLDTVLAAEKHMVYAWSFQGHYRRNGNFVRFNGWEEWELDDDLKVVTSRGWYDAKDYEQQISD